MCGLQRLADFGMDGFLGVLNRCVNFGSLRISGSQVGTLWESVIMLPETMIFAPENG